ncbi:MAG: glycosyltransferase, partial [Chloroflexota bacterium]
LIVAIGRITEQKDPILFLEIYKQLKKEYPFLQAIWVGDGNLRRRMEEFKQNHGIEGFFITGWVNDVRPFIAAANVVVVPSQYESFGYVSAESLAMERAVAATSVNGSIDIIEDGITGYLFLPGDISEGVKKIGNLLVNEDIAVEMAKNGRKKVLNKFTSELMCYNLEQAYNKALKSTVESREYA